MLLDKNKIPGPEALTRPEEIKALSKYLKHIKETQEEHTELDNKVLGVLGRKDKRKFPVIESLDDVIRGLEGEVPELELSDTKVLLDTNTENKLNSDKSSLPGAQKSPKLRDDFVELAKEPQEIELDKTKRELSGIKEIGLDKTKRELSGIKEIELDKTKRELSGIKEIELDETKRQLHGIKEPRLDTTKRELSGIKDIDLDKTKRELSGIKEIELDKTKRELSGIKEIGLDNTKRELFGIEEVGLDDTKVDLTGIEEVELDDTKVDLTGIEDVDLDNTRLQIDVDDVDLDDLLIGLLVDHKAEELLLRVKEARQTMTDEDFYKFGIELLSGPGSTEWENKLATLLSTYASNKIAPTPFEVDLFESKLIEYAKITNSVIESKFKLSMPGNVDKPKYYRSETEREQAELLEQDLLPDGRVDLLKNVDKPKYYRSEKEREAAEIMEGDLLPDERIDLLKNVDKPKYYRTERDRENAELLEKDLLPDGKVNLLKNLGDSITTEQNLSDKRLDVPDYKLPEFLGKSYKIDFDNIENAADILKDVTEVGNKINVNQYLRWAVENTIGKVSSGTTKQVLVDEALSLAIIARRKLEEATKSNLDRLPGDRTAFGEVLSSALSGGLTEAVNTATGKLLNRVTNIIKNKALGIKANINNNIPKNRPDKAKGEDEYKTTSFDQVSVKTDKDITDWENYTHSKTFGDDLSFKNRYLGGAGLETTLSELCGKSASSISSLEDLNDLLKSSPYITSINNVGSSSFYDGKAITLDGNGYWEIKISPLVSKPLNGGFSFLPAFREIDRFNLDQYGVRTYHDGWIPFTGFELSKARMLSKSIPLYEGEFAFPVAAELTNELRITIADDMYKSWRWYFQKCMDVSVYSSNPHDETYYTKWSNFSNFSSKTVVDKSAQLVAFYKNVTFLISIYVLTPQYATIRKFDLLCVLREFSEEFMGEVDAAGAPDLSLSFSIVGEVADPSYLEISAYVNNPLFESITKSYIKPEVQINYEIPKAAAIKSLKRGIITVGNLTEVLTELV